MRKELPTWELFATKQYIRLIAFDPFAIIKAPRKLQNLFLFRYFLSPFWLLLTSQWRCRTRDLPRKALFTLLIRSARRCGNFSLSTRRARRIFRLILPPSVSPRLRLFWKRKV